jgi:hypothetical protein
MLRGSDARSCFRAAGDSLDGLQKFARNFAAPRWKKLTGLRYDANLLGFSEGIPVDLRASLALTKICKKHSKLSEPEREGVGS